MAKPKNTKHQLSSFLKEVNKDSVSLSDNSLSTDVERIDTGNYAMNAILSGSLYGGIPVGLVTGLAGPSMCGKSLIAAKVVANAQKKGYFPIIFETEGAWDQGMKNLGVDIDNCHIMHVSTVEETKSQIIKVLDKIQTDRDEGLDHKVIMVLDSLGALSSQKELDDSLKGSTAVDMGTRAKAIKSMARQITIKCKMLKIPFVFTNHIFDNPAQMNPSLIKDQSGGKGVKYMATILIQFGLAFEKFEEKKNAKTDEDEASPNTHLGMAHMIKGSRISAMSIKNRGVPPFLKTTMNINFVTGLDKYSGLFDLAQDAGVITGNRTYTLKDGTALGYRKDFETNPKIWEETIMPVLEEELKKQIKYNDDSLLTLGTINPDLVVEDED